MEAIRLQSHIEIAPKIYAYQTPGVVYHEGWTKIGETLQQQVEVRIKQQTQTAGLRWKLCWERPARYCDGGKGFFRDKHFHAYLERQGVARERDHATRKKLEWFQIGGEEALTHFEAFARRGKAEEAAQAEYFLRNEQAEAVALTRAYFEQGGKTFLWNAKPRFGKTLTAYDLARQMGCKRVLVLTNRPAIGHSWWDDFATFFAWRKEWCFISENESLRQEHAEVYSREAYLELLGAQPEGEDAIGFVAFESFQNVKGARCFGGNYDKLAWLREMNFDLLIVDEAHEGAETERAEVVIERLKYDHCLRLSGTPYKQLVSGRFAPEQIFTWTYLDEQEAKAAREGEEDNSYETYPRLALYTYQLSPMIEEEVRRGFDVDRKYAFDLMEFFSATKTGHFVYEDKVRTFLKSLSTQTKYPFSTPELRGELKHTLWLLNRVASAKALKKLLEEEESPFADYHVVLAAGDGRDDDEETLLSDSALDQVKKAIRNYEKTITLSVGQLTVGVTVPEWSGIMMLNTLKSPEAYFQATFRVQNPHLYTSEGRVYMKKTAYVFDFDPTRTLMMYEQIANEGGAETGDSPSEQRERRIRRLLNFYPVIGEDEEGEMVELDVAQVLSIPRRIKCVEVVKQGFMSNFLFHDFTDLFRNSKMLDIINKMPEAEDFHAAAKRPEEVEPPTFPLDESGEPIIPPEVAVGTATELFGDKVYDTVELPNALSVREGEPEVYMPDDSPQPLRLEDGVVDAIDAYGEAVYTTLQSEIVNVATQGEKPAVAKRVSKQVEAQVKASLHAVKVATRKRFDEATRAHHVALAEASTEAARSAAETRYAQATETLKQELLEEAQAATQAYADDLRVAVAGMIVKAHIQEEQRSKEEQIRKHLKGFSRAIPAFLMAYGDENLTLQNFDTYVEAAVFEELTGITLDEFRLLRDGGELNGEPVAGHFFDEVVFNDSVKEFLAKKRALANYLEDEQSEDIFDYIPPQKTNQVFTPRAVVVRMVNDLERENPGCFDNPTKTFADLYVKSGLYLAEIAKRLYQSPAMKARFPDGKERIRHIFTRQLYAMAPTRIIHRIVMAYLLGFDSELRAEAAPHFVVADAAQAAMEGKLEALVEASFGTYTE